MKKIISYFIIFLGLTFIGCGKKEKVEFVGKKVSKKYSPSRTGFLNTTFYEGGNTKLMTYDGDYHNIMQVENIFLNRIIKDSKYISSIVDHKGDINGREITIIKDGNEFIYFLHDQFAWILEYKTSDKKLKYPIEDFDNYLRGPIRKTRNNNVKTLNFIKIQIL
ncbi:MAG: hypothetical protein ACRCZ9_12665 [Fusobacteriaceae bacterium]